MDWTARLRLRNLRMLLSLAQTHNISRSAAALNTTQPGLSKWLRELEADIGLPLFERHARGLKPTSYGEALIVHARRIEAHLDVAREDLAAMRSGGSGRVAIGASGASASDTVPLAVFKLMQRMPQASIKLVESTTDRLLGQLGDGDLDLVVGRSSRNLPVPEIRSETLYVEPIHFVTRPRHPLFARTSIAWDDLFAYRWLVWPKGTPIRDSLDDALAAAGRTLPAPIIESNSVTINLTLLNNSDMIGFASHRASMRFAHMDVMRIVPLTLAGFGTVTMYWREDAAGRVAVATMLACLRQVAADQSGREEKGS
jgi:DNA-binding transcriptional LysR family regulator